MAGSIEDNATIYKKKTLAYVPPTPPAVLIETTNYTLDIAARKFIHIVYNLTDMFNVAIDINI